MSLCSAVAFVSSVFLLKNRALAPEHAVAEREVKGRAICFRGRERESIRRSVGFILSPFAVSRCIEDFSIDRLGYTGMKWVAESVIFSGRRVIF